MSKLKFIMIALPAGVMLAGCQSINFPNNSQVAVAPEATIAQPRSVAINIDGKWVPSDQANRKIYYNEFRQGKFAAYTVDGKNTLALGTYVRTADGVKFKYFSQSRNKNINADCKLFGSDKMQCSVEGSVVDLQRA